MTSSTHPSYRLIAAGLLLLAYLTLAGILLFGLYHPGEHPPQWDQVLVIFNAIGALATTAVGVLLGVDIQQGHVEAARQETQRLEGEVALKDSAMLTALDALDSTAGDGAAMAVRTTASQARQQLQRALTRRAS